MPKKNILEEAGKLFKSAPSFRGGIIMGIQLLRDSLQLTAEQNEKINQAIDIISGVSNYRKSAPRPAEIRKIEDRENEANEAVTASEPEAKELPRREDFLEQGKVKKGGLNDAPITPRPEPPKAEDTPKRIIRRPWDKNPNVIRRPRRP